MRWTCDISSAVVQNRAVCVARYDVCLAQGLAWKMLSKHYGHLLGVSAAGAHDFIFSTLLDTFHAATPSSLMI